MHFRQFLRGGYEGVVVKDPDAPYAAGRTGNWQRLKPCMTEDVTLADGTIVEMFRGEMVRLRDDKMIHIRAEKSKAPTNA